MDSTLANPVVEIYILLFVIVTPLNVAEGVALLTAMPRYASTMLMSAVFITQS